MTAICVAIDSISENDVRRKNHQFAETDFRKNIAKSHALFRIKSGSRLIHDDQVRIVDQRLGDPEALLHSSGETAELSIGHAMQIDCLEHFRDAFP